MQRVILTFGGVGIVTMLVAMVSFGVSDNHDRSYRALMMGLISTSTAGAAAAVYRL